MEKSKNTGLIITIIVVVILIIIGIVWYVSSNSASQSSADQTTTSPTGEQVNPGGPMIPYYTLEATTTSTLGGYLVATNGMTLYTFTKDSAGVSNCTGSCATQWPPYTIDSSITPTGGPNATRQLGTITRADGTTQVTYNGIPVYFFAKDMQPGDTMGNGAGGTWFVAKP